MPMKTPTNAWISSHVYCQLRPRQGTWSRFFPILAGCALFVSVPHGDASAAPPAAQREASEETGNSDDGSALSGSGKKITLDDTFTVEGTLEKPSAFYILRRSALDYDWARLDARLSPLVLESVQDPLF